MKIAVIGTGMVGRALASRTAELGHDVAIGTRDPDGALRLYERAGVAPVVGSVLHENEIGRPRSGIRTARARAGFGRSGTRWARAANRGDFSQPATTRFWAGC